VLTPSDLRKPTNASGYRQVGYVGGPSRKATTEYYQAYAGRGRGGDWKGHRRAAAIAAAQDYCDYVNGKKAAPPEKPKLKTAGHQRAPQVTLPRDPEVEAALGVLRDARAQRRGVQGYVYCITDGEYVKIGYSVNPAKRVAELQTGNARPLTLVGRIEGTLDDERSLHEQFISDNVLMDWFKLSPPLTSLFTR
jgi:hypothetical protein